MKSAQSGFAGTNMTLQAAINQGMDRSVPHGNALATLISVLFVVPERVGIRSLAGTESLSENLIKGSILFVPILLGFILKRARPPQHLALQNSKRGALIMFLFMTSIAVASMASACAVDNTEVDVGDKLPPNCHHVDQCGQCFPCCQIGGLSFCCDS